MNRFKNLHAPCLARAFIAVAMLAGACSERTDGEAPAQARRALAFAPGEETVIAALAEFARTGPGTVTRAHCQGGTESTFESGATQTKLICDGPKGSRTVTVIECAHSDVKVSMYLNSIGVFCPEK